MSDNTDQLAREKLHYDLREHLPMWVVYGPSTRDHPGQWVTRMHLSLPTSESTNTFFLADSLESIRAGLPRGLTNVSPQSFDDPTIVEVWL